MFKVKKGLWRRLFAVRWQAAALTVFCSSVAIAITTTISAAAAEANLKNAAAYCLADCWCFVSE